MSAWEPKSTLAVPVNVALALVALQGIPHGAFPARRVRSAGLRLLVLDIEFDGLGNKVIDLTHG